MIDRDKLAAVRLVVFDFDGVFTDNSVYVSEDGKESVRCWRSDGLGLSRLRSIGVQLLIISTETNPVVMARSKKLNVPCIQAVEEKSAVLFETCKALGIAPEETMFVGNDINDIQAFNFVGLPVAVADAYPETDSHILYRTTKPGGNGAVREICDLIYNAKLSLKNPCEASFQ